MDAYDKYRNPKGCVQGVGIAGLAFLLLVIVLFAFSGCKTQQPPVLNNTNTTERTEKEIIRDTTIITEPDSASIKALLRCDSLNNVILNELNVLQGEHIKPSIHITHNDDGTANIQFDCKEDSLRYEIELRDKVIEELRQTTTEIPVYIEKKGSTFLRNSGIALWVIIGLLLLAVITGIVLKFAK